MYKNLLLTLMTFLLGFSSVSAYEEFGDFDDTLYLDLVENVIGDTLEINFQVRSFDDIAGIQFTIEYDDDLSYLGLNSDILGPFNFGIFNDEITFSWSSGTGLGVDLTDGYTFFTLRFLLNGTTSPQFSISGEPTAIEVINADFEQVFLIVDGSNFSALSSIVTGQLFADLNGNCILDNDEIPLSDWIVNLDGKTNFKTDQNGRFGKYIAPGEHTLTIEVKNELWDLCENNIGFNIPEEAGGSYEVNIGAKPVTECSRPEISGGAPFLRRCVDNKYFFTYCNYGTELLQAPEITISYSEEFTFKAGSLVPESVENNQLMIIGEDIGIGECKNLWVDFEVNCETTALGETHCVEASIGPFDNCIESQDWTGADVFVDVECQGEQVQFKIRNQGKGDMGSVKSFIVIEDDVMMPQPDDDFDIDAGDSLVISFPADGTTFRLIAEQEDNHPFPNMPTAAIEGCGTDEGGNSSLGFITQFAESDNAPFMDKFCAQIIGSFDPNDKQGFPRGYGDENFIYKNTDMEYLIRFQNTGNDTAFNVVIEDSLRHELDLRSIQVGPASHPFTWEIKNERTLVFKFNNILLPDSNVNLLGSNGFIKYKVRQEVGHEDGVKITNDAAIFFDFNEPIYTNVTEHTIGSDFIISDIIENNPLAVESYLIYPNPSRDGIWIEKQSKDETLEIKIFGADGKLIHQQILADYLNYIDRNTLSNGLNFYNITSSEGKMYSGKILILN